MKSSPTDQDLSGSILGSAVGFFLYWIMSAVFTFKISFPVDLSPLGRPRSRWKDNIRMDLKEIGVNTRDLFDSA